MKNIKIFAALLAGGALLSSCGADYLEVTPTQYIDETEVETSLDYLEAAINGVHRKMHSNDRDSQGFNSEPLFSLGRDMLADDLLWNLKSYTGWHTSIVTWSSNTSPTNTYTVNQWRSYYEFILNANKVMEALIEYHSDYNDPKAPNRVKYIRGEALAIRAWCLFQLVQYYGFRYDAATANTNLGVPLQLKSEVEQLPRATMAETYTQINKDLDEAATLLDGYKAKMTHYTKKVVLGLQARVALTQHKYPEAAEFAAAAIELAKKEGLAMMTIDQADRDVTPLAFTSITTTTKDAMYAWQPLNEHTLGFASWVPYLTWNHNSSACRTGIKWINGVTYEKFKQMCPDDVRLKWWDPTPRASANVTITIDGVSGYRQYQYQTRKYSTRSISDAVGDWAFMRLSEMYLVAAEAYARAGDETNAKKYLLEFSSNRSPSAAESANTGEALIEEIMMHRRIELWGEGFRWFDLKRLQLPIDRRDKDGFKSGYSHSENGTSRVGFLQKAADLGNGNEAWALEIPQAEFDYNPNMKRNY